MENPYAATTDVPVAGLAVERRAAFITKTYLHLGGALIAFTGVEVWLYQSGLAERMYAAMAGRWLLVLGAFLVVGWIASRAAHSAKSLPVQYLALGGYIVAEALIFAPMIYMAGVTVGPGVIQSAALVSLIGFSGLTAIGMFTGKDFSFLRSFLMWGGVGALVLIVAGVLFGFHLGMFFSVAMVVFAGAAILYDTSNILRHYPEDRYVSASLSLFASVALLFWYVLRIFMSRSGD
ncbi:MAG: Bax inhibitor-1 family protein [Planctomycetota bacterium]